MILSGKSEYWDKNLSQSYFVHGSDRASTRRGWQLTPQTMACVKNGCCYFFQHFEICVFYVGWHESYLILKV
jgi:hypothetical protein